MPRRYTAQESETSTRWVVSYADFVTLLLAFFIVMYTISSVNNKKFEALSAVLVGIFDGPVKSWKLTDIESFAPTFEKGNLHSSNPISQKKIEGYDWLPIMQASLEQEIEAKRASITSGEHWTQIEMDANLLFDGSTADLSVNGEQLLNRLAKSLALSHYPFRVESFIDQTSVINVQESPWLLTALQAANVSYYLMLEGINPQRIVASGYGPFHPLATEEDEEGQAINRRLLLLIDMTGQSLERIKTVTKRHLSAKP